LEYKLLGVGIPIRYLENLYWQKVIGKNGIGIEKLGIDKFDLELTNLQTS